MRSCGEQSPAAGASRHQQRAIHHHAVAAIEVLNVGTVREEVDAGVLPTHGVMLQHDVAAVRIATERINACFQLAKAA